MPKPNINPDHPEDRPVWTDTQDKEEPEPTGREQKPETD
jgi:hypothetical protein